MSATQLRQRLDSIIAYMQPYWEFVNCHMVNYLTDRHWEKFVPQELRNEIKTVEDARQCIDSLFWLRSNHNTSQKYPSFIRFLEQSRKQTLTNFTDILTNIDDITGRVHQTELSIKEFMSEKKRHEVEITAAFVNDLILKKEHDCVEKQIYVIDAGDGKGYLSSRLALQYGHRVLGIDANKTNTEQALERGRKLNRAWNGLTERATLQNQGITPPRRGKKTVQNSAALTCSEDNRSTNIQNYKTTAQFITTDLNLSNIIVEFFPTAIVETPSVCLTGLHTCGNLASTCLKVFNAQTNCKLMCNIGCCYHLLKECFAGPEFFGNKAIESQQTDCGFPMSKYLQEHQIRLGRNARMLAAQSIERTMAAKELPNISLYYRALLEVLICNRLPDLKGTIQVGKIRKFNSFEEYVRLSLRKIDDNLFNDIQSSEIKHMLSNFMEDKFYLDLFYLLRMSFAPILESLILLDRLLYLKELGHESSYLVSLFDAIISPRHFAIVAIRE